MFIIYIEKLHSSQTFDYQRLVFTFFHWSPHGSDWIYTYGGTKFKDGGAYKGLIIGGPLDPLVCAKGIINVINGSVTWRGLSS